MADLWERVKKTAGEIYASASERTVDGVNIGVRKIDVVNLRRELSKEFAGLGGRAYQLLGREEAGRIPEDPTIQHHLSRLRELEQRLEDKEREIEAIRTREPEDESPEAEIAAPVGESGPEDLDPR